MAEKVTLFNFYLEKIKGILNRRQDSISTKLSNFESILKGLETDKDSIKKEFDCWKSLSTKQLEDFEKGEELEELKMSFNVIQKNYLQDMAKVIEQTSKVTNTRNSFIQEIIKGCDLKYKSYLKDSLGKSRDLMPQISESDLDSFILHFSGKSKNSKVVKKQLKLSELKPTQNEFNEEKIILGCGNTDWKDRKYIISKDKYLLDGQHSWASGLENDDSQEVTCYQINLPIKELIRRSNLLKMTSKKDVSDSIVKSLVEDFITSDEELESFLKSNIAVLTEQQLLNLEQIQYGAGNEFERVDKYLSGNYHLVKDVKVNEFAKRTLFITRGAKTTKNNLYTWNEQTPNSEFPELVKGEKKKETPEPSRKLYSDVIVLNKKGEVLLLKRHSNDSIGAGKYSLPGGTVELGEKPLETALRELFEETSIELDKVDFLKKYKNKDKGYSHYYSTQLDEDITSVIDSDEHDNLSWVKVEDLKDYDLLFDLGERLSEVLTKKD